MSLIHEWYTHKRLETTKQALEDRGFSVAILPGNQAIAPFLRSRLNAAETIAFGGSLTCQELGVQQFLIDNFAHVLNPYASALTMEQKIDLRRKGLLADVYITGTNAITENGLLVNMDMYGNRVGAIHFGPKRVFIFAGSNKIVPDLDCAVYRVRHIAAPKNAYRLQRPLPCAETGYCSDCSSRERICMVQTVTYGSVPPGRITVCLLNQVLGL